METWFTNDSHVLWTAAGILAALTIGSLIRLAALRGTASATARARLASLRSWWIVALVVIAAALGGRIVSCAIFALISMLAMREFIQMHGNGERHRMTAISVVMILLGYSLIGWGASSAFQSIVPLAALLTISIIFVLANEPSSFVNHAGRTLFGIMLTVYLLGHAVLLFTLPLELNPRAGGAGWLLFLILLTENTDIMQALIGRRFPGTTKVASHVSPKKTWEVHIAAAMTTAILAAFLGPWLTSLSMIEALAAGLVIALAGFFGDLNMSAVKRHAGVKDSGQLLPGQGGMLDRIDSLTFSAPVFYCFVLLVARS